MLVSIYVVTFLSLFFALAVQKYHILNFLLILEMLLLMINFFILFILSSMSSMNLFVVIIVLSFAVCEASVALAILVSMSRYKNGMLISSLSLVKC